MTRKLMLNGSIFYVLYLHIPRFYLVRQDEGHVLIKHVRVGNFILEQNTYCVIPCGEGLFIYTLLYISDSISLEITEITLMW